jgi:hypothetical protein
VVSSGATRGRRERGEGSITFDTNAGAWIGRLDLGTSSTGKRERVKVRARSRTEVRIKLDNLRREREGGVDLSARGMTFDALAALWLARGLDAQVSEATRSNYQTLIRSRLLPELGNTKLVDLRSARIRRWSWVVACVVRRECPSDLGR